MFLQTEEEQVNLEILDNRQIPICTVHATLLSLHGEWAEVLVAAEANASGLRWGAWVRFWIGEGSGSFEVVGSVTAMELQRENMEGSSSPTRITRPREVLIHIKEFRPVRQRRTVPRHFQQTKIWFQLVSKEDYHQFDNLSSETVGEESVSEWLFGVCIDVGSGGMRIRAEAGVQESEYALLCLNIPKLKFDSGSQKSRFMIPCRVIRRTPCVRNPSAVEIALKFDCLSVEDGIALSKWIAR